MTHDTMSLEQATSAAKFLFAHYPTHKPSAESIQVYAGMFARFDRRVAHAAIQRLVLTHKRFPPTSGEVVDACLVNAQGPRRTGAEAYAEVLAAVRRFGRSYGGEPAPKFRDPLVRRCIGVWGSWNDLCDSPPNDPGGRARFIEMYDELSEQQQVAAILPPALTSGAPLLRRYGVERPEPIPEPRALPALAPPPPSLTAMVKALPTDETRRPAVATYPSVPVKGPAERAAAAQRHAERLARAQARDPLELPPEEP